MNYQCYKLQNLRVCQTKLTYGVSRNKSSKSELYVNSYSYIQTLMQIGTDGVETTLCDSLYIITNSL